jgi:alkylated DNA repair dioxygenase AlkB
MNPFSLTLGALPTLTIEAIDRAIPWINRDGAPRDECFMSTRTDPYTYGSGRGERTYDPIPYTNLINMIRGYVKDLTGVSYEACFSNKYVDEHKHLGWHADDSPSIDHSVGIAVLSFGAERELWIRPTDTPIETAGGTLAQPVTKVLLPHGSLLVMHPGMQQTHQHRIPKHSAKCGTRVSLTFRKLLASPGSS